MTRGLAEVPGDRGDRRSEWFVPQIGPPQFQSFIGLLFLPYTGMVLSFTIIGSMLASPVHWDRVLATLIIYFNTHKPPIAD